MLSACGTPKDSISISLCIALLHDFGKSARIAKKYTQDKDEANKHHKISANFAKYFLLDFLKTNKNSGINRDFIDTVYKTLYFHHDQDRKETSVFIRVLNDADKRVRDNELTLTLQNKETK